MSEEAELHLQQQVFSKREAASWSGISRMVGCGLKRVDCMFTLLKEFSMLAKTCESLLQVT